MSGQPVKQCTMSLSPALAEATKAWIAQDPDPLTQSQMLELMAAAQDDASALAELQDAFSSPLEFGTAGLRGKLGAGPNRMNRVVVMQAAAGLAHYLADQGLMGSSVVIGYDARFNSVVFAHDSADILAAAGFKPIVFDHFVPTPVLAFAIRDQECCAGIMVTASHNPPQDNGYKVYLGDGRQIVPPADKEISARIRQVLDVTQIPRVRDFTVVSADVEARYIASLAVPIHMGPTTSEQRGDVVSVYTAMHGVGWETIREACVATDFKEPIAVIEQRDPDPRFPTVAFPNPEEKGALDLAIAAANVHHADVLLANDPDADRLAVALPIGEGDWKTLHGDQVGALLAWWVIERARRAGQELRGAFASSIVSSMLMEQIARAAQLDYVATLTGFKWVSRVDDLIFGYEEALGYCVNPKYVGDKDGVSAATFVLEMMAALKDEGRTPWDVLDELAIQFGLHTSDQVSVRVNSVAQVSDVMGRLRKNNITQFGSFEISEFRDLAIATPDLPATDGVTFILAGRQDISRARVIVRPSGTEPKIKCYLEVVCNSNDLDGARASSRIALDELASAVQPLLSSD